MLNSHHNKKNKKIKENKTMKINFNFNNYQTGNVKTISGGETVVSNDCFISQDRVSTDEGNNLLKTFTDRVKSSVDYVVPISREEAAVYGAIELGGAVAESMAGPGGCCSGKETDKSSRVKSSVNYVVPISREEAAVYGAIELGGAVAESMAGPGGCCSGKETDKPSRTKNHININEINL